MGATQVEVGQDIGGSTCIVFVIVEVWEVGATPTEVSQDIGVQRASCLLSLNYVKWVRPN
jgi:hypothetical protein